jgi:two-component system response regulator YesN
MSFLEEDYVPEVNILIVEDNEEVLVTIKDLFKVIDDYKCNLYTATDGIQGEELIREIKPHLLITDHNLPGGSGSELAKICKETDESSVIIGVTGLQGNSQRFKANGAAYVLSKPFKANLFLQVVNDRLRIIKDNLVREKREGK